MEHLISYKNTTTSQKYDSVFMFFHQLSSHQPSTSLLRNYRQRNIIPIPAFVAGLQIVWSGGDDRAVCQVGKGTADRCPGGVADDGKAGAGRKSLVALRAQHKRRSAFDGDSVGAYLVGFGMRSKA